MSDYGRLIGEVTLRNAHRVYEAPTAYWVVNVDRHGGEHAQEVAGRVVEYVASVFAGRRVAVEDVEQALAGEARRLRLPFTYGHKLHWYAQDVLLVLVALDRADMEQLGRRYLYDIY